jgi:hypothetical protein
MIRLMFGPDVEEEVIGVEKTAKCVADRNWYSAKY